MSKIIVYSTPGCPYYGMLKEFLRNKGVEFEDKYVSKDIEAAKEMVGKTGHMGVPQMEINKKVIVTTGQGCIASLSAFKYLTKKTRVKINKEEGK